MRQATSSVLSFRRARIAACTAVFVCASTLAPLAPALAASYAAKLVSISETAMTLRPGETRPVKVTFKNIGTTTWRKGGTNYVSLYTWDPKYHASPLKASDWRSASQTGVLGTDVAPGQTGVVTFTVKAPQTPGSYNETFRLAAENLAWMEGGAFSLAIAVTASGATAAAPATASAPTGELGALRLLMSMQQVSAAGGDRVEISVLYKNSGTRAWGVRRLVQDAGLRIATGETPSFYDASWPTATVALSVAEQVNPGNTAYARFTLRAPALKGDYTARFKLVVDDQDVPGGSFDLPVTVTSDSPNVIDNPPASSAPATPTVALIPEPTIRIGTAIVPVNSLTLTSTSDLMIQDAGGASLGTVPAGSPAAITIGPGGAFTVAGGATPLTFSGIVRFVPTMGDRAATMVAAGSGTWSSWVNGARFRNIVEIRYYAPADVTWVINELPIEKYLYGLAEMSNGSPFEYQKALITAARTYAYYHLTHPGKHITFTLDSTEGDQVYRGHNRELQQPNVVRAVDETRGQVIHYDGQPVVTPYYGNSDGRTRAWTEVWGGTPKPWLVSVPATYDIGRTMFGHGVGMSARDAAYRADLDKWTWDQLVKYYYTGVDLKRLW